MHSGFSYLPPRNANELGWHRGPVAAYLRDYHALVNQSIQRGADLGDYFAHSVSRIADPRNLRSAWDRLARDGGRAPGPNGRTYDDYSSGESWGFVRQLSQCLNSSTYQCGPVRVVDVQKGGDRGTRQLGLLNIIDRVVQRAIVQIVQPLIDPFFDDRSYGCRPHRGIFDALAEADYLCRFEARRTWIIDDIRGAFDHIPIERLFQILGKRLPSEDLQKLMRATVGVKRKGIVQGAPLSPLLMNTYLDHVLDRVWRRKHPHIPLVRFVDDVLLLCSENDDVAVAYGDLKQLLLSAGLSLKGSLGESVHRLCRGESARWLGFEITLGDDGPTYALPSVEPGGWSDKIREALLLAHAKADSPLLALRIIEAVADRAGPAYPHAERRQFYSRVREIAHEMAFEEIPSWIEFQNRWRASFRRWVERRDHFRATVQIRSVTSTNESMECTAGPSPTEVVSLYTDGCCLPSKVGGYAFVLRYQRSKQQVVRARWIRPTTNNRAELTAVIRGLEQLEQPAHVRVVTDSSYVARGIGLLPRWKSHGWRRGAERTRPLRNRDLWQQLDELLATHDVSCKWIRGHSGHAINERCDRLARRAAERRATCRP